MPSRTDQPANQPEGCLLQTSDVKAALEFAQRHFEPRGHDVSPDADAKVVSLPKGITLHSLKPFIDEWRDHPVRRAGTASFEDLDSFIAHVNDFQTPDSRIFATPPRVAINGKLEQAPEILSVLDYHDALNHEGRSGADAKPRFLKHRARYRFPLSRSWQLWLAHHGAALSQADFAAFIEDRIADVMAPPPGLLDREPEEIGERQAGGDFGPRSFDEELAYLARLLGGRFATPSDMIKLSRGLQVNATGKFKSQVNLSSGEREIEFSEEHVDATGGRLRVPNLFLLGIAPFYLGPAYRIAVHLRYRIQGGVIAWSYELYRIEHAIEHAFNEALEAVRSKTGLPVWRGSPEA